MNAVDKMSEFVETNSVETATGPSIEEMVKAIYDFVVGSNTSSETEEIDDVEDITETEEKTEEKEKED